MAEEKDNIRLCDCHSYPMAWVNDKRRKNGHWTCRIRQRETYKKYAKNKGEEYKTRKRIYSRYYYHNVLRKDIIWILKSNTKARIKYLEKVLGR